jgi:hypothetical protein
VKECEFRKDATKQRNTCAITIPRCEISKNVTIITPLNISVLLRTDVDDDRFAHLSACDEMSTWIEWTETRNIKEVSSVHPSIFAKDISPARLGDLIGERSLLPSSPESFVELNQ